IRFAEESARQDGRPVRDGEVQTACQQACPARAITFGDMKEPESAMMRRRAAHPLRRYRALEDLNTKPAIVYLADVHRRTTPACSSPPSSTSSAAAGGRPSTGRRRR